MVVTYPTGELMRGYRLLTSHEYEDFYVQFNDHESGEEMCSLIKKSREKP